MAASKPFSTIRDREVQFGLKVYVPSRLGHDYIS